jgi:DNA repair exonuclease SbcCD nuclease subunit
MVDVQSFSFLQISNVRLDGRPMNRLNLPRDLKAQREEEIKQVFQKAVVQSVEKRVDAIFIIGGLWDNSVVKRDTVADTIAFFSSVQNCPIFIVPGQCDPFSLDSPYCSEFLHAIEQPRFSSNVYIFESNRFTTVRHPLREDVTITARAFGDEFVPLEPFPKLQQGFNILLYAEPVEGYFDPDAEPKVISDRAVKPEELVNHGFDYVGLGFGNNFAEVRDLNGLLVGTQSGSLVAQKINQSGSRLAVFTTLEWINGTTALRIKTGDFEKRRIYAVSSDISGLTTEDASIEIAQLLEDEGARPQEDIACVDLEGRHDPQASPKMIVELLKQTFFHAVVSDNTRPDYLTQTFHESSPEARYIEAMLILKRKAERDAPVQSEFSLESASKLSGRTVEDALYYGLDALRQKRVNLRNVD